MGPESAVDLDAVGENMLVAIGTALGPEILIIPIPPRPPGVATAAIVEWFIFLVTANATWVCGFFAEK
jgi:hypothetical protein